jgi:hypothetical protein
MKNNALDLCLPFCAILGRSLGKSKKSLLPSIARKKPRSKFKARLFGDERIASG